MTSTDRSFSAMLNEYLPNELMAEEIIKRDYLLNKVEKDNNWLGGKLIVPFTGGVASSVSFGSLTSSSDVAEYNYQRGEISSQPEVWGTLLFNHRDLMEHGKVSEQNFLQMLPDQIDQFMQYLKEVVSVNMLGAAYFASATVSGTAAGVLEVDHVERFTIGQKLTLDDDDSAQADYYVIAVNLNGGTLLEGSVTLSATRGGAAADISAYTVAQNARCYHPGVLVAGVVTNRFTSLRDSLLSAVNGGSASLYGKTKASFPYLQAINVSGASINATNILEKLFDAYTRVRTVARGKADTFLMSYKHLGSIMKSIETQKGGFKVTATQSSASIFGWTEIQITSVKGELTIVGIQEMDNSEIMMLDWSALKFYSNGFFKKRKSPEGREFFEVRNTTGYQYLVDVCLFGDLVLLAPSRCGIIHSIPNY
jgi:hypothetical protein